MKVYPAKRQSDGTIIQIYQPETPEELEEVKRQIREGKGLDEILPDPAEAWGETVDGTEDAG